MKCLKIDNGKGYFLGSNNEYIEIDKISKEDILRFLNFITNEEELFEMDEFNDLCLHNEAHKIIYRSLYQKFLEIKDNKNRFNDECNSLFRSAIDKYSNK